MKFSVICGRSEVIFLYSYFLYQVFSYLQQVRGYLPVLLFPLSNFQLFAAGQRLSSCTLVSSIKFSVICSRSEVIFLYSCFLYQVFSYLWQVRGYLPVLLFPLSSFQLFAAGQRLSSCTLVSSIKFSVICSRSEVIFLYSCFLYQVFSYLWQVRGYLPVFLFPLSSFQLFVAGQRLSSCTLVSSIKFSVICSRSEVIFLYSCFLYQVFSYLWQVRGYLPVLLFPLSSFQLFAAGQRLSSCTLVSSIKFSVICSRSEVIFLYSCFLYQVFSYLQQVRGYLPVLLFPLSSFQLFVAGQRLSSCTLVSSIKFSVICSRSEVIFLYSCFLYQVFSYLQQVRGYLPVLLFPLSSFQLFAAGLRLSSCTLVSSIKFSVICSRSEVIFLYSCFLYQVFSYLQQV